MRETWYQMSYGLDMRAVYVSYAAPHISVRGQRVIVEIGLKHRGNKSHVLDTTEMLSSTTNVTSIHRSDDSFIRGPNSNGSKRWI